MSAYTGAVLGWQNAVTRRLATFTSSPIMAAGYGIERQYSGRVGSVCRTAAASAGANHDIYGADTDGFAAGVSESITYSTPHLVHQLAKPSSYRYWRLRLGDHTAFVVDLGEALPIGVVTVASHNLADDWTSSGYTEIGQIGLWLCVEADQVADLTDTRALDDWSLATSSPYGARVVRDRPKPRQVSMSVQGHAAQIIWWRRLLREVAGDGYVLAMGDPVDRTGDAVQGVVSSMPSEGLATGLGIDRRMAGLVVTEDLA